MDYGVDILVCFGFKKLPEQAFNYLAVLGVFTVGLHGKVFQLDKAWKAYI